jgi:hypothetical protein
MSRPNASRDTGRRGRAHVGHALNAACDAVPLEVSRNGTVSQEIVKFRDWVSSMDGGTPVAPIRAGTGRSLS